MMFDIIFIAFLLIFSLLCFVEFIVFNEEVLLALCFFSFIFFSFNTLSDSVAESFESRALKFENDLLVSFDITKKSITTNFFSLIELRNFVLQSKIFFTSILVYINLIKTFAIHQLVSNTLSITASKLNELQLLNNKLILNFQKNSIITLLYPLILKTIKINQLSFGKSLSSKVSFKSSTSFLKNLSI
jgi:hypothetical protein